MDSCIIRTLAYFDIFDYPLNFSEIKKYLCCYIEVSDDDILDTLDSISIIQQSGGYYYFLGRSEIVKKRGEREVVSIEKKARAVVIAKMLSVIPTIELIGISGSLSMNNAEATDDIDLFFITKKNTLWLTRFLVNVLLLFSGQKRGKKQKFAKDKICPNMFMEEGKLGFTKKQRTEYVAHEIAQMRPIFVRNNMYKKFISFNKWIQEFLPNVQIEEKLRTNESMYIKFIQVFLKPIEKIFYSLQIFYMRRIRTRETVSPHKAFFHPIDRNKVIMNLFEVRYERYLRVYEDNIWIDKEEARFFLDEKKIRILN